MIVRALALILALLSIGVATSFASRASWTIDEPDHVRWSERLIESGITERTSQHTFNSKTPIQVPAAALQNLADDPTRARFLARVPTLAWLAALYALTAVLGGRWFGPGVGVLALGLLALDPNPCAHGGLATVDVAFAVAVLAWLAATRFAATRPGPLGGLLFGAAVALAFTAKFTAIVVLPAILLGALVYERDRWRWRGALVGALTAFLVFWFVVSLSYGFIQVGWRHLDWESELFQTLGPRLRPVLAAFPRAFVSGLDQVVADDRTYDVNVVFAGRSVTSGQPAYFVYHWLHKTPLALLLATVVGLLLGVRRRIDGGREAFALSILVVLVGAWFSFAFETQLGYRYVLMLLSPAYLLAARGWADTLQTSARRGIFLSLVALGSLVELFPFRAHPLAFTNALVWDKREAFRHVADSNIDWGQDSEAIARWVAEHDAWRDPYHLRVGTNVFGASLVAGVWFPERYRHLREEYRTPDRHLFFSHVVYEVDAAELDRYLDRFRTVPGTPCTPTGEPWSELPEGTAPTALCVDAPVGSDLVIEARGEVHAGSWDGERCDWQPAMYDGHTAWFRIPPGTAGLCLEGGPASWWFEGGPGSITAF